MRCACPSNKQEESLIPVPASKLRFLVVEDQEFQREALIRLLRTLGAEAVYGAEDGLAALQVIRDPDRPVDIVISDLSMPGMDGMEFLRNLGEIGARVSVILLSALDPPLLASIANMALAYRVRLLGVLGKPAAAAKLTPLIEQHRATSASPDQQPEAAFSFAEIAQAWADNEFEPWYEPRVHLETGAVRAMHACARWRHPTLGVLEPDRFLPSVKARGLQDDFVWLMLQKSAAQCSAWRAQGLDLTVAAALDFASLAELKMAPRIRQIAINEELEPRCMVLGVREGALNAEVARALENLARLRVDGFGLSVEDFGGGPMELEQISRVAFTELKIHSAFVTGVHQREAARAGLAVALELAQQLRLETVADGITDKEEWKLLREWGCDLAQGPFISQALPADRVPGWVARWSASTIR